MVLIYRTNIQRKQELKQVTPLMNNLSQVQSWSVDLEDCDKVLRVVTNSDISTILVSQIKNLGFMCGELD